MSDDLSDTSGDSSDRPDGDQFDWNDTPGDTTGIDETDATSTDQSDETDAGHGEGSFSDLDGTIGTETSDADPFAALDSETGSEGGDPFERMSVDEVDIESVWDALDGGLDDLDGGVEFPEADPHETTDHVVDKRKYCHRCPHFAAPPDTACTHEGTSILEVIGFDEFRVRDCPMVTDEGPGFDRRGPTRE